MNGIDNTNVHLFCRTCLNELETPNAVVQEKFDIHEKRISKWVMDCTSLMVRKDDKLPKYLCHQCYQKLKFFTDFRAMSHRSMSTLQSILEIKTKDVSGVTNDSSLSNASVFQNNDSNIQENTKEMGDKNLVLAKLSELEGMNVESNDDKKGKEPKIQMSSQLNDTLVGLNFRNKQETTQEEHIDKKRRSDRPSKNYVKSGIKCCIKNCKRSKRHHGNIKLFKFPRADLVMGRVWREKCNIPKWEYHKNLNICDRHFDKTSIGKKYLTNGAFPTLFLDEIEKVRIKQEKCNLEYESASTLDVNKINIDDDVNSTHFTLASTSSIKASSFKKVCRLCQKCFSKAFMLEAHILQEHQGEKKPFVCKYCTLAFPTHALFEHHLRNTHEEAWFHNQDDNSQQEFLDL